MPEPIKITKAMVQQYNDHRLGVSDPCIICGGKYWTCGHRDDTPDLIKRIKAMGAAGRKKFLNS